MEATQDLASRVSFVGGRLCLDFTNTNSNRGGEVESERLASYADLVTWGRLAELLTPADARRLLAAGAERPAEAGRVFARARQLREAIYRIVGSRVEGKPPAAADLDLLNHVLMQALAHRRLTATKDGFAWEWMAAPDDLGWMLWPIASSAAELLMSEDLARVKECASQNCNWLFVDASRNRSRRWCDMKDCGNRAKARRHYQRGRRGSGEAGK
jgi:predicted RNA-binding Zn ribbon-like protein